MNAKSPVLSMTGFASTEGNYFDSKIRIEIKSLNHRFLDLKIKLPREMSGIEIQLRSLLQSRFTRGTLDIKIDKLSESKMDDRFPQINLDAVTHYFESMKKLQKTIGNNEPIKISDLLQLPDVLSHSESASPEANQIWTSLQPTLDQACKNLLEMRKTEGSHLIKVISEFVSQLEIHLSTLRSRRTEWMNAQKKKFQEKVKSVFESYPAPIDTRQVLESRISQELALLADRSDIEEELVRFSGHIEHFKKTLEIGGAVGRKLDFILQELNREINTLSNKALDLSMSEVAVKVKSILEQIREQVMNLE